MKVQVGVFTHKMGKMLERCLKSLADHNAGVPYELVLQISKGSAVENWNALYDRMDGDFNCIMEDDTAVMRPFWLRSLVDTLTIFPRCGIVMPIETKDGSHADPGFLKWMNKHNRVDSIYGFCNVIRGGLDVRADINLKYFHDIDLGYQAMSKGYQLMVNGHVMMLHGSPNGNRMSDDPEISKRQEKDQKYLKTKWGIKKN